ncbi:hypothetical protein ACFLX0_02365 [Chloroflexota bacterium]
MENTRYVCPGCGYESEEAGLCLNCQTPLLASCPTCGNPVVGEHVRLEG